MPSSQSARLNLPYVAAGQLQKHVTVNEALTRLDGLIQTAVISRTVAAQPVDPQDGDLYILPESRSGAVWSTWGAGDLVRAEFGGWTRVPVPVGMVAVVLDEGQLVVRDGAGWSAPTLSGGAIQNLTGLGLNTTADAANPFAARINSALLTARPVAEGGTGALRLVLNKDAGADVMSVLFQRGYSGRAELGLIGDDELSLKVSADGSTWREAFRVDPDDGRVAFPAGALRTEAVLVSSSSSYVPPAWARTLTITAVGGGGGGGTGAFAASGDRFGGGGGVSTARWSTADLAASLSIVVGAGGAGGAAGQATTVSASGSVILSARGGGAGASGGSGGTGGPAGLGLTPSNAGGASLTTGASQAGQSLSGPGAPGGGGGGGALDVAATLRASGAGGDGGVLLKPSAGGAAGSGAGAPGSAASAPSMTPSGGGGAGGAPSASAGGFAGGNGATFGGGGGGGGAGATSGGAGGPGAGGAVLILAEG